MIESLTWQDKVIINQGLDVIKQMLIDDYYIMFVDDDIVKYGKMDNIDSCEVFKNYTEKELRDLKTSMRQSNKDVADKIEAIKVKIGLIEVN